MNIRKYILVYAIFGSWLCLQPVFPEGTSPSGKTETSPEANRKKPAATSAIARYEPALAVRGSACLTCHAKVHSTYITDFGYGTPFFFGNPKSGNKVGPFNGNIYGDFIAEAGKTGWLTADFQKEIIVPEAALDFSLKDAGGDALAAQSPYKEAFRATSLAGYLRSLEDAKPNPAHVLEKKSVFIGAPDASTLEKAFGLDPGSSVPLRYIKTDPNASQDLNGIAASENGDYYTNASEVLCDGDLFIRGPLLLNRPSITTVSGCRIYAAGPIFLQGALTFQGGNGAGNRANLQLVSSEAIFLGVGRKKCGTTTDTDPLSLRLLKTPALPSIMTRAAVRAHITPQQFAQNLYDQAAQLPLEDSSCHDETLSFSRILLNAPIVHSRYSGTFKGLVIAEFALFWQGKSSYEFDPVFKEVPVLPMLQEKDYLLVE